MVSPFYSLILKCFKKITLLSLFKQSTPNIKSVDFVFFCRKSVVMRQLTENEIEILSDKILCDPHLFYVIRNWVREHNRPTGFSGAARILHCGMLELEEKYYREMFGPIEPDDYLAKIGTWDGGKNE